MLFRSDKKDDGGQGDDNVVQAPLLPLRDIIVFPHMVVPLFVGRQKSIRALEEASRKQTAIFLASQKDARTNEPGEDDIYPIGTLGNVVQMLKLPDGTVKVLVEGKKRGRVARYLTHPEFFLVEVEEMEDVVQQGTEVGAVVREVHSAFENYVKVKKKIPPEMVMSVSSIEEPGKLADTIIGHLGVKLEERQVLLETINAAERLEKVLGHMRAEIEILEVERRIRSRVKKQMERSQKEYYLNEQMRAIQKELGEKDEFKNEMQEIEEKIKQKKLSAEAKEKVEKELKKLKMMSPMSAEATVVRNYIDWILSLPWYEYTEDKLDIGEAEKVLEEDHYGLGKVKERILEYLAVQSLVGKIKGPILCLVGPPGVGKTSLGRSIARATGREFVRVSLGGVRDEAEIRGHRRTYIGALPGKIIQSLKKAGSSNPVFLMDEVDKMSMDFPRRPVVGAAGGAGPGAEPGFQRPLPGPRLRPLQGDVRHHRQHAGRHPAAVAGPDGDHTDRRLHGAGEAQHRQEVPGGEAARRQRAERRQHRPDRQRHPGAGPPLHQGGGGAEPGARDRLHLPQGRRRRGEERPGGEDHGGRPEPAEVPGAGQVPLRHGRGAAPGRHHHRVGVDRAGRRACCPPRCPSCRARASSPSPASSAT